MRRSFLACNGIARTMASVFSRALDMLFPYSFPKTIDGDPIFCMPRGPFRILSEYLKRKTFSWNLYLASARSHDKLPKAPAVVSSLHPSADDSMFPMPPEPSAMSAYVLSYYPEYLEWEFYRENMLVDVMRDYSMRTELRRYADNGHVSARGRNSFVNNTNGLFVSDERRIILRDDTLPQFELNGEMYWQNVEDVLGHEIGHFLDWKFCWVSTYSKSFMRAFKKERGLVDCYSASTPSEFFATCAWMFARFPNLMWKFMPKTAKWFDGMFAELDDLN